MNLHRADIVSVPKAPGIKHYGLVVGTDVGGVTWVLHGDRTAGRVVVVPVADYAAGRLVTLVRRAVPGTEDAVVARASQTVGSHYALLTWNCEHVVTYAESGLARSGQVFGGLVAGLVATLLVVAVVRVAR